MESKEMITQFSVLEGDPEGQEDPSEELVVIVEAGCRQMVALYISIISISSKLFTMKNKLKNQTSLFKIYFVNTLLHLVPLLDFVFHRA